MKIVLAATPKIAIPSINSLLALKHEIQIVTQPDRPAGRGLSLRETEIAKQYPLALKPIDEPELQDILKGSELLITIGYGRILNQSTLNIPKYGGINLHFSLLPKWRGAAPVQRAIEAGDPITGVTVFQMDEGIDTGDIWIQEQFEIPDEFSSIELFERLGDLGAEALGKAVKMIAGGEKPIPQVDGPTYAPKISKSETLINWQESAADIARKVRAFAVNPVARSVIRGEVLKISKVKISESTNSRLAPGELSSTGCVGTSKGEIQLIELIPAGRRAMSCNDWLNGFRPKSGEKFD